MRIFYISLAIAVFIMTAALRTYAEDEIDKLIVNSKSGITTEIDLSKIGKVTFDNSHMMIVMDDGSKETLNIKDIDKLTFDLQISDSGVEKIEAEAGANLHITVENNIMIITECNNKDIDVMVYNSNGAQMFKTQGHGSLQIDFNGMNSNVYIIKANDKIIKYIR